VLERTARDALAVDERPVGRSEILELDRIGADLHACVLARDAVALHADVGVAAAAKDERALQVVHLADVRAGQDDELSALATGWGSGREARCDDGFIF